MRETADNERTDRLEIHNSCVDERLADAHLCALVHLPASCRLPIRAAASSPRRIRHVEWRNAARADSATTPSGSLSQAAGFHNPAMAV
jgi:hypothetical protein